MLHIKTPATSANMGSGFDCIGTALQIYNNVFIEENDAKLKIEIKKEGMFKIPTDRTNMIYTSIEFFYNEIGKRIPNLKIIQEDYIPMTRGLGSSAACIVNGLVAANEISKAKISKDDLAFMAAKIEGHPDNTAPAILGGVIVGVLTDKKLEYAKIANDNLNNLHFVVMIPNFPLSTEKARSILPKAFTVSDCVYNMSRAALLTAALIQGDFKKLGTAMEDVMHQNYRSYVIPDMNEIFKKARELDIFSIYLSGAGSTLVALTNGNEEFLIEMRNFVKTLDNQWSIEYIPIDMVGTTVEII